MYGKHEMLHTYRPILGHVSSVTTLNTYSHVTDEMRQKTAVKNGKGIAKAEVQRTHSYCPARAYHVYLSGQKTLKPRGQLRQNDRPIRECHP